ncbi:dihydroxyacetone kinase subunit DhaL [Vibrio sp. SCSIO 43137]|uniref:dihydroxyacetone kinase subunit DhaL n=1 Tax=Vibrio sp. SCSIO 43137 TaxID=3021011 RepID=UPI002307BA47|nr:dihydroxyacetone kinase subunit DhaL [Vibrio sp. SCSIO 43137]WCE32147.1 dihydroxyacetone kinase subunit DhaL [Vibrio sp. SCSIO 43137]
MSEITKAQLITWLTNCSAVYSENRDMLTELDAAIGDADHGLNMDRGFAEVAAKIPTVADKDIANVFKVTGMTLLSKVGGASGPLYGTLFIRAATKTAGKESLTLAELVDALQAGVDGVIARGKAEPGDKTMCDVWWDVIAAARTSLENDETVSAALATMAQVAEAGVEKTIPMLAKKGRASYLGERSVGHADPGATSAKLMVQALNNVVNEA